MFDLLRFFLMYWLILLFFFGNKFSVLIPQSAFLQKIIVSRLLCVCTLRVSFKTTHTNRMTTTTDKQDEIDFRTLPGKKKNNNNKMKRVIAVVVCLRYSPRSVVGVIKRSGGEVEDNLSVSCSSMPVGDRTDAAAACPSVAVRVSWTRAGSDAKPYPSVSVFLPSTSSNKSNDRRSGGGDGCSAVVGFRPIDTCPPNRTVGRPRKGGQHLFLVARGVVCAAQTRRS